MITFYTFFCSKSCLLAKKPNTFCTIKKVNGSMSASLQKKHAPDNIIFSIEPIDNRLPALEDGLSWRTLIHHYHISKFLHHQFLILKKNVEVAISYIFYSSKKVNVY